jgi:cytochrome c oxidase subunit 3
VNFFRQIVQKPWVTVSAMGDEPASGKEFPLPTAKVGLRVILGVVTVVFLLLIISYAGRMAYSDWLPLFEPWLLWVNTGWLAASSIAFHAALIAARRGLVTGTRDSLLVGGAFALLFLVGQFLVWRQLFMLGYFAETNPANAFFYVITGLHALHLLGGLVAWARTFAHYLSGVSSARLILSLELCTTYWHFLLLVWLIAFGLLILT